MRKRHPMSALLTGLLAAPVLGATGLSTPNAAVPGMAGNWAETFPAEMPAGISERMRRLARGEKLNTYGMQGLQSRMARMAQTRISRRRAEGILAPSIPSSELVPVQMTQSLPAPAGVHREKVAFLGVGPLPVPEALGAQLNLPRGMGLLAELIEADSPADKAGLKKNDVLQKLDDQWLINAAQMQVLIHSKKPGDTVTFSVIRGGKAMELKVTLGTKETPAADAKGETSRHFVSSSLTVNADGSLTRRRNDDECDMTLTRDKTGTANVVVKDRQGKLLYDGPAADAGKSLAPDLAKKVTDLMNAPNEVRLELQADGTPGDGRKPQFTLNRDDAVHEITIRSDAAGRHLTVKEVSTGKVLFDGLANREEDYKSLPAAVLEKVRGAMEKVK